MAELMGFSKVASWHAATADVAGNYTIEERRPDRLKVFLSYVMLLGRDMLSPVQ